MLPRRSMLEGRAIPLPVSPLRLGADERRFMSDAPRVPLTVFSNSQPDYANLCPFSAKTSIPGAWAKFLRPAVEGLPECSRQSASEEGAALYARAPKSRLASALQPSCDHLRSVRPAAAQNRGPHPPPLHPWDKEE